VRDIVTMTEPPISYKRHRFPPQIIAHAVWLYFRFPLSLRLIEELLLERGIAVYYETVRHWAMKFGLDYARRLKRKKPGRRDIWHLDEIVQVRRNTRAAKRLLERLLRKQGCPPKRMITDKLGSYGAARRKIMPKVEHRQHKGLNNRAEHSHVPIRKRERAMQGFRSWSGLQKFVETFSAVRNLFVPTRSHRSAFATHLHRLSAMAEWKSVTCAVA
jgi:putative transposase